MDPGNAILHEQRRKNQMLMTSTLTGCINLSFGEFLEYKNELQVLTPALITDFSQKGSNAFYDYSKHTEVKRIMLTLAIRQTVRINAQEKPVHIRRMSLLYTPSNVH